MIVVYTSVFRQTYTHDSTPNENMCRHLLIEVMKAITLDSDDHKA